jgi:type IV secretion system protein VirB4
VSACVERTPIRLTHEPADVLQHPDDEGFARDLSIAYQRRLDKHRMMSNELYLTLVYESS